VNLRCELRSTLGSAALQYESAGFRGHPRAKAMGACPFDFAGLERAFHLPFTCLFAMGFMPWRKVSREGYAGW